MHELMTSWREWGKRHLVVIALVALAVVEVFSVAALIQVPSQPGLISYGTEEEASLTFQPTLKISEIQGSRIDDEAAMVVVEESLESTCAAPSALALCSTLPIGIWVFLVAAYVALLIFNFSYTFTQATRPQWFFEAALTMLALIGWYAWDGCRTNNWVPFAIVKFGLIVFALYAYLLEKKLLAEREQAEKTESMF